MPKPVWLFCTSQGSLCEFVIVEEKGIVWLFTLKTGRLLYNPGQSSRAGQDGHSMRLGVNATTSMGADAGPVSVVGECGLKQQFF